jgi:hypothetical protein
VTVSTSRQKGYLDIGAGAYTDPSSILAGCPQDDTGVVALSYTQLLANALFKVLHLNCSELEFPVS